MQLIPRSIVWIFRFVIIIIRQWIEFHWWFLRLVGSWSINIFKWSFQKKRKTQKKHPIHVSIKTLKKSLIHDRIQNFHIKGKECVWTVLIWSKIDSQLNDCGSVYVCVYVLCIVSKLSNPFDNSICIQITNDRIHYRHIVTKWINKCQGGNR